MQSTDPDPAILAPREREVAILVAEGLTKKEIARRQHRTIKTIDVQVTNVYAKLGLDGRVAVCRWAIRHGLIVA